MLSAAESDLARRDTELRYLSTALDADVMAQLISSRVDGDVGIELQRRYIRYKPGMNCLVRYTGQINGSPLDCYIKTYGSDSAVKLAKARVRPTVNTSPMQGRLVFDEHASVITFFPNDDKLKKLRSFKSGHLSKSLQASLFSTHTRTGKYKTEILAYKPERRFVACCEDNNGGKSVIKLYSSRSYEHSLQRARLASQWLQLPLPRLQASSDEFHAIVFDWQEGHTLAETLARGNYDTEVIAQTGETLARLHEQNSTASLPSSTVRQDTFRIIALAGVLAMLLPDQQVRIRQLSEELIKLLQRIDYPNVVIHGDFYARQVLTNDKGICLLDTDELRLGDPATDLGNFIAHLEYDRLNGNINTSMMHGIVDALLESYRRHNNVVNDDQLAMHTAFALFHLSHQPFRDGGANWPDKINHLINACWQWLEASRRPFLMAELLERKV